MLSYSRLQAGREVAEPSPIDVRDLINEVRAIIEPLAIRKRVEFHVTVRGPYPERFVTDPGKLRQIMLNLIGNAIEFTDSGSVEVSVCATEDWMRFEIRDTGIGIASQDLSRLFEPFWQVDSSRTRVAGGTGLGLAITRRYVDMLGGDIAVTSTLGEGSTFVIRLPMVPPDVGA
jgi:signal transduction histidine kinase